MRLTIILLCITGFLAKDIARMSWEIWFKVNQAQIIAEKCENKDVPTMHCDGKCYLAKKLQKLEQKEQNHNSKTNPFSSLLKIDLISNAKIESQLVSTCRSTVQYFPTLSVKKTTEYSNCTFHPPA